MCIRYYRRINRITVEGEAGDPGSGLAPSPKAVGALSCYGGFGEFWRLEEKGKRPQKQKPIHGIWAPWLAMAEDSAGDRGGSRWVVAKSLAETGCSRQS